MPLNKAFALRIQIIDDCLRRRQRTWSMEDLLEEVNNKLSGQSGKAVSIRTIYGDVKAMTLDMDAPIESFKQGSKTCYRYADPNYSIRKLPVQQEDIQTLRDAIELLTQVKGFPIADELRGVVERLENTVSTNIEGRHGIIQFEHHVRAAGTERLQDLFEAIKGKTVLRIQYQPFGKEAREHIIHPYLLKEFRNRWFLLGRIDGHSFVTNLALDRIQKVKPILRHAYIENNVFDPDAYFDNLIGVTWPEGAQPETITLRVSAALFPYIHTKPIHHSQTVVREFRDGSRRIRLCIVNNYELRMALMSMGPRVVVEKPVGLRKTMGEMYKEGLRHYETV
jgi:predicted DNA-binding transcriptional regulator YafY